MMRLLFFILCSSALCLPSFAQIPDQIHPVNLGLQGDDAIRIVGDQALVGLGNSSTVQVFQRHSNATWQMAQEIDIPNPLMTFWRSWNLETAGNRMVASSSGTLFRPDEVYVYEQDSVGIWNHLQTLVAPTAGAVHFGSEIILSEDGQWLMVGSPGTDRPGGGGVNGAGYLAGMIWAYRWDPQSHSYPLDQEIAPPSSTPTVSLGIHLEMADGRLLAASDSPTGSSYDQDEHDFFYDGTSWVYAGLFPIQTSRSNDNLAMRGDMVLVPRGVSSSLGFVDIFQRNGQGASASWSLLQSVSMDSSAARSLAWDSDNMFHVVAWGTNEAQRFERPTPSSSFQGITPVMPWFGLPISVRAYSPNEYLVGMAGGLNVVRPGQTWLGTPRSAGDALTASGIEATLSATGSIHASDNDLTFHLAWASPGQFGYLLASRTSEVNSLVGVSGNLLLGGPFFRFNNQIQQTDGMGAFSVPVNVYNIPGSVPSVIYHHEEWFFQAWFRDPQYGSALSNGVRIFFL